MVDGRNAHTKSLQGGRDLSFAKDVRYDLIEVLDSWKKAVSTKVARYVKYSIKYLRPPLDQD